MALLHAWLLATALAAILAGAVLLPASLLGVRISRGDVVESVCALALGVMVLAEVAAAV